MPTPRQIERAKKIMSDIEKRDALLANYLKGDTNRPETPFDRVIKFFLDMSGTPEADKKNTELLASISTPAGQQKMFVRFMDKVMSADLSVTYSGGDLDRMLDEEERNPGAATCAFSARSVCDSLPAALKPYGKAKDIIDNNLDAWEECCIVLSTIGLVANEIDIDSLPKTPDADKLAQLSMKDPKYAASMTDIIALISEREKANAVTAFEKLAESGVNGADIYRQHYLDANGNPLKLGAAIEALKKKENVNIVPFTREETAEQEKLLVHGEKYGARTSIGSKTPVAHFAGVSGVGASARTTKAMDSMDGQGAFYGGLEVSREIKEQLETQPVAAILNMQDNNDGTFRLSFKIPDKGRMQPTLGEQDGCRPVRENETPVFAGGEFNIRRNFNILSKALAGYMLGEDDTISYGSRAKLLEDSIDGFQKEMSTAKTADDVKRAAEAFVNVLNVNPDGDREELTGFFTAAYSNSALAARTARESIHELKRICNYSAMDGEREKLSKSQLRMLKESRADYARMVSELRRVKDMDVDAETEVPFHQNCMVFSGTVSDVIEMYNVANPDAKISHGKPIEVNLKKYAENHPEERSSDKNESTVFERHFAVAVDDIHIGDKTICLSIENSDPTYDRMLMNNGSNSAIGFFDSRDDIIKSIENDAFCLCDDEEGLDMLKYGSQYEPGIGYTPEQDGAMLVKESAGGDPLSEADKSIGADISAEYLVFMAKNEEEYINAESNPNYEPEEWAKYGGPSNEAKALLASVTGENGIKKNDTPQQRAGKLENIRMAAEAYLRTADPNFGTASGRMPIQQQRCVFLARAAYKYAAGMQNAADQKAYDRISTIESRAKAFAGRQTLSGASSFLPFAADKAANGAGFDFEKFNRMSDEEKDEYLNTPSVMDAIYEMSVLGDGADSVSRMMRSDSGIKAEQKTYDDIALKSVLFKALLEGTKLSSNSEKYMAENPGADRHAVIDGALRAGRALAALEKFPAKEKIEFRDAAGRTLDTRAAAMNIIGGEGVRAFTEKSPVIGAQFGGNGSIEPMPVVDKSKVENSLGNCVNTLSQLGKQLAKTDNIMLMTNSEEFKNIKLVLTDMSDPKKHWTDAEKTNAMPYIEKFCNDYLKNKTAELNKKGSLDARSTARVKLVTLIRDTAAGFGAPEVQAPAAHNEHDAAQAGQNGAVL